MRIAPPFHACLLLRQGRISTSPQMIDIDGSGVPAPAPLKECQSGRSCQSRAPFSCAARCVLESVRGFLLIWVIGRPSAFGRQATNHSRLRICNYCRCGSMIVVIRREGNEFHCRTNNTLGAVPIKQHEENQSLVGASRLQCSILVIISLV